MKKLLLILILCLLPVCLSAQSLRLATFGNAADTSDALVIGNHDLFTGLIVPDDIDSDSLRFLVSQDGSNYFNLYRHMSVLGGNGRRDSTSIYYLVVGDTTTAYYTSLPEEVFKNIRKMKIITDDVTSASDDIIRVLYEVR